MHDRKTELARLLVKRTATAAGPAVALLLGVGAAVFPARGTPGQPAALVQNERLQIVIESSGVTQFRDLRSGHNFAQPGSGLWEIQLRSGERLLTLTPAQAGAVQTEPLLRPAPGYRVVWRGFPPTSPHSLAVEVAVTIEAGRETSCWRIAVDGLDGNTLTQVRFPILRGIAAQEHEQLAVPVWMGQLTSEPRRVFAGNNSKGKRSQWHYPGELSLQCLALWGESAGLYAACNDTAAFRKAFAVFGDGTGELGCDLVHWPEAGQGTPNRWALPYDVVLGTFHGDWFTAAERYRSWGTNQAWAAESRVARDSVPNWISNTALWVWNRGRSDGVLEPAAVLQKRLGLPVSVFWHWWHGCAYDTGFPEYLPPREGSAEFKGALARAHSRGVKALVYMNQRLWGMNTESWRREGAAAWAVKGPDGQIHPEVYNTFTRAPCASMCLGTPFWRDKYAGIAEQAVLALGVDGVYMDQACLSLSCYDPAHGHPTGGGTYWVDGFRLLAGDIRARCGERHAGDGARGQRLPALAGEGCGEPWLPHLDLMLSLQVSKERYAAPDGWETIPFFHAVYHPYAVLFGNYSSLTMPPYDELWPEEFAPKEPLKLLDRKYAPQFRLEQARAFVWGQQATLANFRPGQLDTRAEEIDYVVRLARLRHRTRQYLQQGTLLRPPGIQVAETNIPISRLSIYAGQQDGLTTFEKTVPLAIASAWQAPDGDVALALASIAEHPLAVALTIPLREYGLSAGRKVIRLDETGKQRIATLTGSVPALRLELPPRGACLLELGRP